MWDLGIFTVRMLVPTFNALPGNKKRMVILKD
jgi:hypothetical protein